MTKKCKGSRKQTFSPRRLLCSAGEFRTRLYFVASPSPPLPLPDCRLARQSRVGSREGGGEGQKRKKGDRASAGSVASAATATVGAPSVGFGGFPPPPPPPSQPFHQRALPSGKRLWAKDEFFLPSKRRFLLPLFLPRLFHCSTLLILFSSVILAC